MRLILCCLFGLVLTLVSAVPPENCPDDYDSICRTDYRYRVSHDWIPYANASSGDGIKWRVLVDQHDYQNIFGPFFFPAGKWKELDADGDRITWVHGSGGTCTYQVRVNSYRRPGSNNWYFTQALSYCDAEELIVNASVRFSSCTQRPNCIHDYVYLHRFDTNSPNEDERIKPENYNYYLENEEDSKLKQEGTTSDTEIIKYFRRPDTTHTYFGIQDIGTTGQVQRFMVYYKVCQKNQAGLAIYPEVPLPPHTSGPSDRIMRLARCVAHAHNVTSLETYAYKDRCVQNVQCDCDPGYEQSADSTACMPCTKGYYKTSLNSTCVPCPKNSNSDEDGADHCECIDGYYRAPNEGVGMICTAPPDPIPNKLRIVSMCDTTAELQWDKPGEVGRDDFYYAINRTNPDTSEEFMINTNYIDDRDVITFKVTGLAPKTTYTFTVCVHNGVSQFDQINDKLRVVAQQATTRQGSVFMHNNMELSNNSVVLREEIGEGEKALICQTLSDAQCGGGESLAMFFPNSTEVLQAGNGRTVYSTTGDGQVRLNRKLEDDSPLGSYYCRIPDRAGNIRKMFIRIATIQLSGEAPTCPGSVDCGDLSDIPNGEVDYTSSTVGSTASYTCNTGFELVGQRSRSCQLSGIWEGTVPSCQRVDCGSLSSPTNGQISVSSTTFGGTASYTCSSGYNLSGATERICQHNGQWSGTAPVCVPVPTSSAPPPTTTQQPTPPPTTTQQPTPPPTTTQRPTPPPTTTQQPTPPPSPGLRIELNGDIYHNGSMVYIDDIGEGNSALICHTNRSDCCSTIGNRYGEFYYPNGTVVGIKTKYESMYRNRGLQLIRLNRNSGSSSLPPTGWYRCEIPTESSEKQSISINIAAGSGEVSVECPQLSDPIGGSVTVSTSDDVIVPGSRAMYLCDDNHQLSGSSVRVCQEDGTWSESEPTCEVIICPDLTPPDNGNVNRLGNAPGSLALYACNDNFELSGDMSRECGPNGQWTGEAPLCEAIAVSCPPLEHPGNGLVTPEGNSPGSVATYSCNGGHSLLGSATSECQSNGAWSNQPPTCAKIGFQWNGEFHASGSSLPLSSIGEGDSALLCVTDGSCCTPPNRFGEFYYPDNTRVDREGSGDDFYRDRGDQMIRLNRRNGATSPTGTYKCAIPDSGGVTQEIFITLN